MSYLDFSERNKHTLAWYNEWVCFGAFVIFAFTYLFFYQNDVLAAGQHVLSGGQTHYNRTVGAVLITIVLCILQRCVYHFVRLSKRAHALTYFPSLLVLTVITDVSSNIDRGFSFGGWYVALPIIAVAYVLLVILLRQMEPFEPDNMSAGLLSRPSWINLLTMVAMFMLVGLFSNADATFHYRMRVEKLLLEGEYRKALKVGRGAEVTDASLTMLRAYALAHERQLGNHFFDYPLPDGSFSLLPDSIGSRTVIMPDSLISLYARKVGVRTDYKLLQLLIDRKLREFLAAVVFAYPDSLLPRHFEEALVMYRDVAGKDSLEGDESAVESAYHDFCLKEKSLPKATVANAMRRAYGHTYWYYYKYGRKQD